MDVTGVAWTTCRKTRKLEARRVETAWRGYIQLTFIYKCASFQIYKLEMLSNKNKQHMAYTGGSWLDCWQTSFRQCNFSSTDLAFFACRTSMKKSLEEKYPWLEQDIYTSYQSKVTLNFKLFQHDLLQVTLTRSFKVYKLSTRYLSDYMSQ